VVDVSAPEKKWVYDLAACLGSDRYGEFRGIKGANYAEIKRPVTQQLIGKHLESRPAIALPILCEPGRGRVIVCDFDDHERLLPAGEMDEVVCAFAELLTSLGIKHIIVRSGSGTGYHVWIVLSRAVRKDILRGRAKTLLAQFNEQHPALALSEGTKGVSGGQVELFPKGDGKGAGGLIALPLARKSVRVMPAKPTGGGRWTLEPWPEPIDPLPVNVPKKSGPKPSGQGGQKPDRDAAFDAYVRPLDPADYDQWCRYIVPHLMGAFGSHCEWAFGRWAAYAKQASNAADDAALREKWDSFADKTTVSESTFWLTARDRGYAGPLPFSKREERKAELDQLTETLELLHGDDGLAYAKVDGFPIAMPVDSQAMRDWIRLAARDAGGAIKKEEVNELVETAGAVARSKPRTKIALRVARDGDAIFICHADAEQNVTRIDRTGWSLCSEAPIVFRRGRGEALDLPVQAQRDVFFDVLNIDRPNTVMLLAWTINALLHPGGHSPIALLGGEPGATKSATTKTIVRIVDPTIGSQAGPPKNEDDLVSRAHGSFLLPFDNADSINHLSDPLCRVSTGGGVAKRKLYTDADVFALDVCRPVIVNGIDTVATAQDLIERSLRINLKKPERYMSDKAFNELLAAKSPELVGALFQLAADVLAMLDELDLDAPNLRFHDFVRVGECVARIFGFEAGWFVEMYREMLDDSATEALSADPVAQYVVFLCRTQPDEDRRLELLAGDIFEAMHRANRDQLIMVPAARMPSDPRRLSSQLTKATGGLAKVGIRVSRGTGAKRQHFIFEWDGADMTLMDALMTGQHLPF
jgi:hypothetical protein